MKIVSIILAIFLLSLSTLACSRDDNDQKEIEDIVKYVEEVFIKDTRIPDQYRFKFNHKTLQASLWMPEYNRNITFMIKEVEFNSEDSRGNVVRMTCSRTQTCIKNTSSDGNFRNPDSWVFDLESGEQAENLIFVLKTLKEICVNNKNYNRNTLHSILYKNDPQSLNKSLYMSVKEGNKDKVSMLLSEGGDVNYINPSGMGLLHAAFGDLEMTKLLLEKGVNVNQQQRSGGTLLHYTTSSTGTKGLPSAKLYISYGARTDIRDNDGDTVIDLARKIGNKKLLKLLTGSDADESTAEDICQAAVTATGKNLGYASCFCSGRSDTSCWSCVLKHTSSGQSISYGLGACGCSGK